MEKKWTLLMGKMPEESVYFIEVKGNVFSVFEFRICKGGGVGTKISDFRNGSHHLLSISNECVYLNRLGFHRCNSYYR